MQLVDRNKSTGSERLSAGEMPPGRAENSPVIYGIPFVWHLAALSRSPPPAPLFLKQEFLVMKNGVVGRMRKRWTGKNGSSPHTFSPNARSQPFPLPLVAARGAGANITALIVVQLSYTRANRPRGTGTGSAVVAFYQSVPLSVFTARVV
ncbi:hypothetical protein J6590_056462 [Homalodisca vitripennis]|nr:hypothetical protein J6590_056462 [Homalodisca vitripennis]